MDNPLEGHSNRYDAASVASMFQTGVFPDGYGSSSSEDDYFDLSDPEATADDPNAGSSVEESPVSDMVTQPSPSSDEESPVSPMATQFTPPMFDSPSQSSSSPPPSRSLSQSQPPSPPQSPRGTPMTRCGRGRGVRGRGARCRVRTRGPTTITNEPGMKELSVIDTNTVSYPAFSPQHTPGLDLPSGFTPSPLNYFLLYFNYEMIDEICINSNTYAEIYSDKYKFSYDFYPKDGLARQSFYQFLSVVIFMGTNPRTDYFSYWSTDSIFSSQFIQNGPISRNTFSAILTFLHVSDCDPTNIDKDDRLHKVRNLLDKLRDNCKKFFYPSQNIAVDERMVKSKARFSCKQYIRLKPVKWGFKLWVLAYSETGYTWNFNVYRGKEGETVSSNGLGFDVVTNLVDGLENQGFVVYTDNFTLPQLYLRN